MNEHTKTIQTNREGPSGSGIFDDPDGGTDRGGAVRVQSGIEHGELPVGGLRVGEIRRRHADRLQIAPGAPAFLDGAEVGDDTIVRAGQYLNFVQPAGEKGRRSRVGRTAGLIPAA